MGADQLTGIPGVLSRMDALLAAMPSDLTTQRTFLSTYRRTTIAVGKRVEEGRFEDPAWVDRWDVAFADLYVSALEAHLAGGPVSRPWRQAFAAPAELPVLRLLLLGINAHINYDLPQALLAVIGPEDFANAALLARRERDHERIDTILAGRVSAEDAELSAASTVTMLDRMLRPFNQAGWKTFFRRSPGRSCLNSRRISSRGVTSRSRRGATTRRGRSSSLHSRRSASGACLV